MKPVFLNTPDPMVKTRIITTRDDSTEALKTLHRIGALHVEESEELKPVDKEAIESERAQADGLLTTISNVLAYMPEEEKIHLEKDIEVIYVRPFSEIDGEVRPLCAKLSNMHQRAAKLKQESEELKELKEYLEPLEQLESVKLGDLAFSGDYLFSRVFIFPTEIYETLRDKMGKYLFGSTIATIENETILHTIAQTKNQRIIETTIKDNGGRVIQVPNEDLTLRSFLEESESRICSLDAELAKLNGEIESKTRESLQNLILFREALSAENERLSVLEKACEAKYVTLIEGWIPENSAEDTISQFKENIAHAFIDTRKPKEAEQPPTKQRNLKAFRPFQVIVNLFGTPKYREWDPTPAISYSFAFFFGLMLGDVVYSVCLMLLAKFGLPKFVDDPESEAFKQFQSLFYISSGVSLVVGLLAGSYLGDFCAAFLGIESLALAPGFQSFLLDAMTFLAFAIVIGLIHVNIGHVIAIVRGIKERNKGLITSKIGLFILEIAGVPWILNFLGMGTLPLGEQAYSILLYFMLLGVVLIIAASIMQYRGLGAILWLFDITGLLGDIMSYCRLAGVGLATYYLAVVFNMIAGLAMNMMPANTGGLIIGILLATTILLFGHVFNLLLSTISCFVHSLRLCFVEFLLKFYDGGGSEYSPFRLRKRMLVPIRGKA